MQDHRLERELAVNIPCEAVEIEQVGPNAPGRRHVFWTTVI